MSFILTKGVLQQQANRAGGKQYALEFDGGDDYVELGASEEFNLPLNFSITAKIIINSFSSNNQILCRDDLSTPGRNFHFRVTESQYLEFIYFVDGDVNFFTSTKILSIDQEYYVVVIYDGNKLKFYINNELTDERNETRKIDDSDTNIAYLGSNFDEGVPIGVMDGIIYQTSVWHKTLSSSEIQSIGVNGINGSETDLAYCADYSIGEGNVLPDKTDNNNDGDINGANWIEL